MLNQTRRTYTREFKEDAVRLAARGDKSAAQVARDLGVHYNVLLTWIKQFTNDPENAFPGKGKLKPVEEENRRLRRQLADVEEERDILKKALAIFSTRRK